MKKLLLSLFVLINLVSFGQVITDSTTERTRINADIVPNGTKAITAAMLNRILNGYLNIWPKYTVDSLKRSNDSVFYRKNKAWVFSHKDSVVSVDTSLFATKAFTRGDTLINPCQWVQAENPNNPITIPIPGTAEVSKYAPTPIMLKNGDIWVYVKEDATSSIYAYESIDDGRTFQNHGLVLAPGAPGQWDDTHNLEPRAVYDTASGIIYLFYKGSRADPNFYFQLGVATANDSDPTAFTKFGGNPILTRANFISQMGITTSFDLTFGDIVKKDGLFYFFGSFDTTVAGPYSSWVGTSSSITGPIENCQLIISPTPPFSMMYRPTVFKYNGLYYMIITEGYNADGTNANNLIWNLRAAHSTNLINWTFFDCIFKDTVRGTITNWESAKVFSPHVLKWGAGNFDDPIIFNDGSFQLYYGGRTAQQDGLAGMVRIYPNDSHQQMLTTLAIEIGEKAPIRGGENYIQNRTTIQPTSNFFVSDTAKAGVRFLTSAGSATLPSYSFITAPTHGLHYNVGFNSLATVANGRRIQEMVDAGTGFSVVYHWSPSSNYFDDKNVGYYTFSSPWVSATPAFKPLGGTIAANAEMTGGLNFATFNPSARISFFTGNSIFGTAKLIIDSMGLVAIHTLTPDSVLSVNGSGHIIGNVKLDSNVHVPNLPLGNGTKAVRWDATNGLVLADTTTGGGGLTGFTTFGSSPNANGGSVSGANIILQPADATNPGGISLSAQTFGDGDKTFSDDLYLLTNKAIRFGIGGSNIQDDGAALYVTGIGNIFMKADGVWTANFNNGKAFIGGTTAPTEVLHVGGNVRFSGALMPNNLPGTAGQRLTSSGAGSPPTWENPTIEGTYLPTLTNTTNVAASTAYNTNYIRIGDFVFVFGEVDIDATSATTITELQMSLPIGIAISNTFDLAGTGSFEDNTSVKIAGTVGTNTAKFRFTPQTSTNNKYSFHFSYKYIAP